MQRIYRTTLLLALLAAAGSVRAQQQEQPVVKSTVVKKKKPIGIYGGLGLGIDYGGIGARMEIRPLDYLGIFAAAGYNLNALGYNVGFRGNVLLKHRVQPFATVMYGYNGVIVVTNASKYNNTYYGLTTGAGVDFVMGHKRNTKLSVGVLVPFRNSMFWRDYDQLKDNPDIKFDNDVLPVGITIGVNFRVQ